MNAPWAGSLRTRVRFDPPSHERDRSGEMVTIWPPVDLEADCPSDLDADSLEAWGSFFVWAGVKSQPASSEGIAAGQLLATATYEIQMRWRADICASMSCVLPDGKRLDILSEPVDPDGTKERIRIRCEYRGGAA